MSGVVKVEIKELGERIRLFRVKLGLTQAELAGRAKLGINSLQRIENGTANPTMGTMQSLAMAMDTDIGSLTRVSDQPDPQDLFVSPASVQLHEPIMIGLLKEISDRVQANQEALVLLKTTLEEKNALLDKVKIQETRIEILDKQLSDIVVPKNTIPKEMISAYQTASPWQQTFAMYALTKDPELRDKLLQIMERSLDAREEAEKLSLLKTR